MEEALITIYWGDGIRTLTPASCNSLTSPTRSRSKPSPALITKTLVSLDLAAFSRYLDQTNAKIRSHTRYRIGKSHFMFSRIRICRDATSKESTNEIIVADPGCDGTDTDLHFFLVVFLFLSFLIFLGDRDGGNNWCVRRGELCTSTCVCCEARALASTMAS